MNSEHKIGAQCVLSLVVMLGVGGCGPATEQPPAAKADEKSQSAAAKVADDYVRPRDFIGTDVCALVSADTVVKAANVQLIGTEVDVETASCTYIVRGDASYDSSIHVSLMGNGGSFVIGRNTASKVENITGLGDDAYVRKIGGEQQINVERNDGLYVTVIAPERDTALAVARLVLDSIPR